MIDLKALVARRWRLTLDESAEITGQTSEDRAWLWQIPAKCGHVYVHGTDRLGAYCTSNRRVERLLAVPGAKLHQRGDREFSVTFPPEQLAEVAEIIQCRKRRQMTPEQIAAAKERLAPFAFAPRTSEPISDPENDFDDDDGESYHLTG